jgi:hypothetical protein
MTIVLFYEERILHGSVYLFKFRIKGHRAAMGNIDFFVNFGNNRSVLVKCRISSSHSGGYEEYYLLGYNAA